MRIFQKSISIQTKRLNDFINITNEVQRVVEESKIKNGMAFVNSLHNTAALIIQEDDQTIFKDLANTLEKVLPLKGEYEHNYEGDVNATAHIKSNLLGSSLTIPLKDGKLVLGSWQNLHFVELFEPRKREVVVTIVGD